MVRIMCAVCILLAPLLALFTSGCTTLQNAATPARIQAVTALGAYIGAKAAIGDGKRTGIEAASRALHALQDTGQANLPAIVAAVQAAGVPLTSAEGGLAVTAGVLVFSDLWAGTGEKVLDDARAKAVLAGTVQGFDMALQELTRARGMPGELSNLEALHRDIVATRSRR